MARPDSLSQRDELLFWGWGYVVDQLTADEQAHADSLVEMLSPGGATLVSEPAIEEFDLPAPRFAVPEELHPICSTTPYDRLTHAYGKSFADATRMLMRQVQSPPDVVAFPKTEAQIAALLAFAASHNVAVIPFGGGSSVCGGVEAAVGDGYSGVISLDMENFDKLLEVDEVSRTARLQGGMFGPAVDAALRPYGLTLRHFPQSYQLSTVGGWVATRSGGHFATLYTHIDDLVESIRMVTPQGVIETRRLPGSGAGPSADRMMIGSEGILGVITEVCLRVHHRPRWKASVSVVFDSFIQGAEAVRAIAQAGLYPANCRLLDEAEALFNGVVREPAAVLVVGFESADHPVQAAMDRALDIATALGGRPSAEGPVYSEESDAGSPGSDTRAEAWKNAFLRAPYLRNRLAQYGVIIDTFETSITWERFADFYMGLKSDIDNAIREITGEGGFVSCRLTHVYPDGACVYITFGATGSREGDLSQALDRWRQLKQLANDQVVGRGGTVTHHHAVGRDHRSGYEAQSPELYRQALAATKASLDPAGIMNPGVLIDPLDRDVGITGVMQPVD